MNRQLALPRQDRPFRAFDRLTRPQRGLLKAIEYCEMNGQKAYLFVILSNGKRREALRELIEHGFVKVTPGSPATYGVTPRGYAARLACRV